MDKITLPLLRGRVSLAEALAEDGDVLHELSYPGKRYEFWVHLYRSRPQIEELIARHLGIPRSHFELLSHREWFHGSFNAILPFQVSRGRRTARLPHKGIIRFSLPYKIGEEPFPGNVDEKLRCETATYVWLQHFCPDIPVPRLLGFGFPGGQSFTSVENSSFFARISWYVRRGISRIFGSHATDLVAPYIPHRRKNLHDLGYMIIEHVSEGQMLSASWEEHKREPERRENLIRGLSRIMLSLTDRPLPRIASWTINNGGILGLTNRPLTMPLQQRENLGIPTEIPRDCTYTSAEPYYLDMLATHENQIREQPNSFADAKDGESQLAGLAGMRSVLPLFTERRRDVSGSTEDFFFSLTDLHPSNIFVDDDWNITKIIDLEWACARPREMVNNAPYWLSGYDTAKIPDHLDEYAESYHEYLKYFGEEEKARYSSTERTDMIRARFEAGGHWYFEALDEAPSMMANIFAQHILPQFPGSHSVKKFDRHMAPLWDRGGCDDFIAEKLRERDRYFDLVRDFFRRAAKKEAE